MTARSDLQTDIEERLSAAQPDVEVIACERIGADRLRLFIDRDGGVDLALCEAVTNHLRDLLPDYALEVSSPGPERPLTKPEHFRRFLGRRARIKTERPRDGRRKFTGELVEASDTEVTVAVSDAKTEAEEEWGLVAIPYSEIDRSHLLEG
jgi:ribosome maturation factor RimP